MLHLSIAQILAAALLLAACRLAFQVSENRRFLPFLLLALAAALQATLVSLRWDFDVTTFRPLQILLACILPPLAWLAVRSLSSARANRPGASDLIHLLPAVAALVFLAVAPLLIDAVIIITDVAYGIAFVKLLRDDDSVLDRATLFSLANLRRAIWLIVISLLGSSLVDILVMLDFMRTDGAHAATYVSLGALIPLAALLAGALFGASAIPEADLDVDPEDAVPSTEDDAHILEEVRGLLAGNGLAKDPELSLSRIARRLSLPARSVSRAINRQTGLNVSQFVNDIRIAEACRLLAETEQSVTSVIYDSGFQTKSNFNREFLRVTGQTPRAWRQQKRPAPRDRPS